MNEVWKDIEGYEDSYQVSNYGNVRSLDRINFKGSAIKGVDIKPSIISNYKCFGMSRDGVKKMFKIHRIVANAFVHNDNIEKYDQVDHIDGDKLNNHCSNLRWCSCRMNLSYFRECVGVNYDKNTNTFTSRISFKNNTYYLGSFDFKEDAKNAYDKALLDGEKSILERKIRDELLKCVSKSKNGFRLEIHIFGHHFTSRTYSTRELVYEFKDDVLLNIENINKYRDEPYCFCDLLETLKNKNTRRIEIHKYYDSFKHLLKSEG